MRLNPRKPDEKYDLSQKLDERMWLQDLTDNIAIGRIEPQDIKNLLTVLKYKTRKQYRFKTKPTYPAVLWL